MLWKLVKNDLRHQIFLQTFNIAFFIFVAVTFLATASQLTVHLTNSIESTGYLCEDTTYLTDAHW